ncbi:ATP-binding protein [Actinomadura fibrosa]|uniref:ATP-binding protein n=1 Tax=Actinomadura fibrosa TaxID=111802 RepID=A0ABW2XCP0_9ACTN|nr:ATP-binding protein [Actinomadura fibrosa]
MTARMERLGEPLRFAADPGEGRRARRAVRDLAAKAVTDDALLDDVELMAAEAIANAVLHGSGMIRVVVAADEARLRVEVCDDGPSAGERHGRRRIDHGRGLTVIDALAGEWELDQTPRRTQLWFEVEIPAG